MAPSATEVTTLPTRISEQFGPYKSLAAVGYERKTEEEGKDGFKAAKVWEPLLKSTNMAGIIVNDTWLSFKFSSYSCK
jgi:hypothetical protein